MCTAVAGWYSTATWKLPASVSTGVNSNLHILCRGSLPLAPPKPWPPLPPLLPLPLPAAAPARCCCCCCCWWPPVGGALGWLLMRYEVLKRSTPSRLLARYMRYAGSTRT
jgi:hypothetical protein